MRGIEHDDLYAENREHIRRGAEEYEKEQFLMNAKFYKEVWGKDLFKEFELLLSELTGRNDLASTNQHPMQGYLVPFRFKGRGMHHNFEVWIHVEDSISRKGGQMVNGYEKRKIEFLQGQLGTKVYVLDAKTIYRSIQKGKLPGEINFLTEKLEN